MDKKKTIIIAILAIIGFILTIELAYIFYKVNFHDTYSASFCSVSSLIDCDGVAKTDYAMFFGVPLALWGLFLYTLILFLNFVHILQNKFKNTILDVFKNPKSYIATFGVISFSISMVLACVQFFAIGKICVLCFVTYFIDFFIALVAKSKGSFFIEDIKNTFFDFIEGVKKYTVLFIVVLLAFIAFLVYTSKSYVFSPNMKVQKSFEEFQNMKRNPYAFSGNLMGSAKPEMVVSVYSDFLCPFCKVTNTMLSKFAREEKTAQVVHYNFPLDSSCNPYVQQTVHPGACMNARYALAAQKQGKYWDMVNLLFDMQTDDERTILYAAQELDFNMAKLIDDASSKQIADELSKQIDNAHNDGIFGTPTIEIDGITYTSAMPYHKIKTLYKQAQTRHKEHPELYKNE